MLATPSRLRRTSPSQPLSPRSSFLFTAQQHFFHILPRDPLPLYTALFLLLGLPPQTLYLHDGMCCVRNGFLHVAFLGLFVTVLSGFTYVAKESAEGHHTRRVQYGLRLGVMLFIASEVMFFFAFFGAFFHYSLAPSFAISTVGPPLGVQVPSPWELPLINTLLLLFSGVTITVAHARLLKGRAADFGWALFLTVLLGICFLLCQGFEYRYGVDFSGRENIYGSIFFITTGFHGLHVTIGTLFLTYCLFRHLCTQHLPALQTMKFTREQHLGFEAAAGYGHFVDVVWLFLFLTVYGGGGDD